MLKISRTDLDALAEAGSEIAGMFDDLEALREKFAEDAANLISEIAEAKERAAGIMGDAANEAEQYHDEKSEKWQEGDRGQAYAEWRDRLREVSEAIQEDIDAPSVADIERPEWVDLLADPDFSEFEF